MLCRRSKRRPRSKPGLLFVASCLRMKSRMQILHHIALRLDQEKEAEFHKAGISFKKSPIISSFDIAEDDPRWPQVLPLTHKFKVFDTVSTKFSAAELNQAPFLGMVAAGHHGYPEPS